MAPVPTADDAGMRLGGVAFALVLLAQASQAPVAPAPTSDAGFRYERGRLSAGRVYRYRRSNLDGSDPGEFALYLASETRIAALSWSPGAPGGRLVEAEMDWERVSVAHLESFEIDARGERRAVGELELAPDGKRLVARVDGRALECALARLPWHGRDFLGASLNAALRFLADPEDHAEFEIVDLVHAPGGSELVDRGTARLVYAGEEEHAGLACRRYALGGGGLGSDGSLWAARGDEVYLVGLELELPRGEHASAARLEWLRSETMSAAEWDALVRARGVAEPR